MISFIIDDDKISAEILKEMLLKLSISKVYIYNDSLSAIEKILDNKPDIIFLDLYMSPISGEETLNRLYQMNLDIPIIMISSEFSSDKITTFLQNNATDFLLKPFSINRLRTILISTLKKYRSVFLNNDVYSEIRTQADEMFNLFNRVSIIAETNRDVLITGETGTGKELIANAIHKISEREGKMISVNLGGVDDHYFNDVLFGHVKGSYTGAHNDKMGMVDLASGGTLFLDEIGDIPINSQVKLMRFLQEREYQPLGCNKVLSANVRVICATSLPLESLIEQGTYRQDLFYRLKNLRINIPPLRNRRGDIDFLFKYFVNKATGELGVPFPIISSDAQEVIKNYHFPGNVRELEYLVFQILCLHKNHVEENDVFDILGIKKTSRKTLKLKEVISEIQPLPTLEEISNELIKVALVRSKGNLSEAANILDISRQGLSKRVKKFNLLKSAT